MKQHAATLWKTAKAEHIGGRKEQQDRTAVFSTPDEAAHLLIVADGMGGHRGGALASQAVIDSAQKLWNQYQQKQQTAQPEELLQAICDKSQEMIIGFGEKLGIFPHSTCVLLFIQEDRATWTHLGDSRLYHFREDNLQIRTKDHSIVQMLVDMGRIREEDMATHRDQGRLLKGLGGDEPPELEFHHSLALAGDAFILCSDGLWERLSAKEMQQHLQPFGLKKKAKNLVELAARRGGKYGDNVAAAAAYRVR